MWKQGEASFKKNLEASLANQSKQFATLLTPEFMQSLSVVANPERALSPKHIISNSTSRANSINFLSTISMVPPSSSQQQQADNGNSIDGNHKSSHSEERNKVMNRLAAARQAADEYDATQHTINHLMKRFRPVTTSGLSRTIPVLNSQQSQRSNTKAAANTQASGVVSPTTSVTPTPYSTSNNNTASSPQSFVSNPALSTSISSTTNTNNQSKLQTTQSIDSILLPQHNRSDSAASTRISLNNTKTPLYIRQSSPTSIASPAQKYGTNNNNNAMFSNTLSSTTVHQKSKTPNSFSPSVRNNLLSPLVSKTLSITNSIHLSSPYASTPYTLNTTQPNNTKIRTATHQVHVKMQ